MADNQEVNQSNQEQRELRLALLDLRRSIDQSSKRQEKSSRSLEKRLEATANSTESMNRILRSGLELGAVSSVTALAIKKYGVRGGVEKVGTQRAQARMAAEAMAKFAKTGQFTKMMMASGPMLKTITAGVLTMVAVKKLFGGKERERRAQANAKMQVQMANNNSSLLQESLRQTRGIEELVAIARAGEDPFSRGTQYARIQASRLGIIPSPGDVRQFAAEGATLRDRAATSMAFKEQRQLIMSPVRMMFNDIATAFNRYGARTAAGFRAGVDDPYGATGAAGIARIMHPAVAFGYMTRQFSRGVYGDPSDERSSAYAMQQRGEREAFQKRRRQFNFQRLMEYGPATVSGPSSASEAGTVQQYRAQVMRQVEDNNRRITRQWQLDVLDALQSLILNGEATLQDRREMQLRFGMPIEGVD